MFNYQIVDLKWKRMTETTILRYVESDNWRKRPMLPITVVKIRIMNDNYYTFILASSKMGNIMKTGSTIVAVYRRPSVRKTKDICNGNVKSHSTKFSNDSNNPISKYYTLYGHIKPTFADIIPEEPRPVRLLKPIKFLKCPIFKEITCRFSCETSEQYNIPSLKIYVCAKRPKPILTYKNDKMATIATSMEHTRPDKCPGKRNEKQGRKKNPNLHRSCIGVSMISWF